MSRELFSPHRARARQIIESHRTNSHSIVKKRFPRVFRGTLIIVGFRSRSRGEQRRTSAGQAQEQRRRSAGKALTAAPYRAPCRGSCLSPYLAPCLSQCGFLPSYRCRRRDARTRQAPTSKMQPTSPAHRACDSLLPHDQAVNPQRFPSAVTALFQRSS